MYRFQSRSRTSIGSSTASANGDGGPNFPSTDNRHENYAWDIIANHMEASRREKPNGNCCVDGICLLRATNMDAKAAIVQKLFIKINLS